MRLTTLLGLRNLTVVIWLAGFLCAATRFTAQCAQAQLEVRSVLLTGSAAPGIAGATVSSLGLPFISEGGHVLLQATLSGAGVTTTNDRALYLDTPSLGLELVFREGSPASGTSYAFAAPRTFAVDANGVVALRASLAGAPTSADEGVWSGTASGLLLRELQGQPAPSASSTFSNVFLTGMNGSASGSYIASVNTLSNGKDGIWIHGPGGLKKVAMEGEIAPGTSQTIDAIGLASIDAAGGACFAAALSDLREGIWIDNPTPMPVVLSGQNLPIGAGSFGQFSSIGRISANARKKVAFMGGVTGVAINSANDKGIWTDRNGAFELIARTGAAAPGMSSVVLTNFSNVLINGSNQIAFVSRLQGSGYSAATDMALYFNDSTTGTISVMHTGMAAPGTPAGVVFSYTLLIDVGGFNRRGSILFSALVNGPGVTADTDTGYWLYSDGELTFLAREGDDLEVTPGTWRTISRLFPVFPSSGEDGLSSHFNSNGQFVFLAEFTGGSRGVFLTETASTISPPGAPILFLPTVTSGSVALSWSNPPKETHFMIERRVGIGGSWQQLVTRGADITTYVDEAVIPSTTYYYRVLAANVGGSSPYSNIQNATVPNTPPPSPSNFVAYPESSSLIRLQWSDVAGESGYQINRTVAGSWSLTATLGPNATQYADYAVEAGTGYQYSVSAFNSSGFSTSAFADVTATDHTEVFFDDFDPQAAPEWSAIDGASVLNSGPGFPGSNAIWFGGASTRHATTGGLNVSTGAYVRFRLRGGNQAVDGQTFWDDSEAGEDVVLEYAVAGNWIVLQTHLLSEPIAKEWREYVALIPVQARTSSTQFRWRQVAHSGSEEDVWALDDISIWATIIPAPSKPAYLSSSTLWATVVKLLWAPSAFADSYVVERESVPGIWQLVGTFPRQGSFQVDDTGLIAESSYQHRVKAINTVGESDYTYATVSTWSHLTEWQYRNFGPFGEAPDMFARDGNGNTLTHRFAFNLDLSETMSAHVPGTSTNGMPAMWLDQGNNRLQVEFVSRNPDSNPRIDYIVQFSSNLGDWSDVLVPTSTQPIDWVWQRVRYQDPAPPAGNPRRFVRVKLVYR